MAAGALLLLVALVADTTLGQLSNYQLTTCPGKTTCSQCIQTTNCRWCTMPNFTHPRCHGQIEKYCPEEYTVDPSNTFQLVQGRELTKPSRRVLEGQSERESYYSSSHYQSSSSSSSSSSFQQSSYESESAAGSIVQISPQRVSLKLRLSKCNGGRRCQHTDITDLFPFCR